MITNFELIFQRISSCFTLALGEVVLWRDGARRHIHPHIHHIILLASPAYSDSPAYLRPTLTADFVLHFRRGIVRADNITRDPRL